MKSLATLRALLATGEFEFTQHALRRVVERNISEDEIRQAGAQATIVEEYPADKYSPSCLLLGFTTAQRPLHIQVSKAPDQTKARIITIYVPDPAEWIEFKQRRK